MHFFILPGPDQGPANQVLGLVINGHAPQPSGDERIAVADGNHFFAFEREEEKLENCFARRFAIVTSQQSIELFLGFLCDGFHGGRMEICDEEATVKLERRRRRSVINAELGSEAGRDGGRVWSRVYGRNGFVVVEDSEGVILKE